MDRNVKDLENIEKSCVLLSHAGIDVQVEATEQQV